MSESSDATHEAILHNVIRHQRNLARQVSSLQSGLQAVNNKLDDLHRKLDLLIEYHDKTAAVPPANWDYRPRAR